MYSPLGRVSKVSWKWLAWLIRKPCAGRTAPSESVTARRSSPERSCAPSGETSRRTTAAWIRATWIKTRRRWILRGRPGGPWDILQPRRAEAVGRKRDCFRAGEASRIDPRFDAACVGTAAPGCPSRAQLVLVSSGIAIPECPHPNGQQSTGIRGGDGGHGFLWRF